MSKTDIITASLLGSASALGLNWIYDKELLDEYKKDHEVIFIPIDHELYKKAKNGFDVYPNHQVGDLDFMGEVLYKFYEFYNESEDYSPQNWRKEFYNYFNEEGPYSGYIEHYGKDLLLKFSEELNGKKEISVFTDHIDKQLIGPAFLLAMFGSTRAVNKVEDSLTYSQTLTAYKGIRYFDDLLYNVLFDLKKGVDKIKALKSNIFRAPKEYQESLNMALTMNDIDSFITEYSGVACGLEQAFPLIYYIVAHADNWEDALRLNASLGGASSARGMFISAIFNIISGIPKKYLNKLNYKK